jgi:hypothetical protein
MRRTRRESSRRTSLSRLGAKIRITGENESSPHDWFQGIDELVRYVSEDRQMIVRILLLATTILFSSELPANSKGSAVIHDDPWDPHHIDDLPCEVRQYIAGICKGPPSAERDFATYSPRKKRWRIHLEYLRCDGLGEYRRGNQCLNVDFVEAGTRYRLGTKVYRDCGH